MPPSLPSSTRRDLLRSAGAWSAAALGRGLTTGFRAVGGVTAGTLAAGVARAGVESPRLGLAPLRSCILVFQYGGPSHLETFDPKPLAPDTVRGEFGVIPTAVPGLFVGEHLPHLARVMDRCALVRSLHHQARLHDSASIHMLTGRPLEGPDRELFAPQPQFHPCHASAVAKLTKADRAPLPIASLPFKFRNVHDVPAQGAGFLGLAWDPLWVDVQPEARAYAIDAIKRLDGTTPARTAARRDLLDKIQPLPRVENLSLHRQYEPAYRLLTSTALEAALDLSREPESIRSAYGYGTVPASDGSAADLGYARGMRGQNLLLARRLVEAGSPFVTVNDFRQQGQNWDAHAKCFDQHRKILLPEADRGLATLIADLESRGLLESTLIVVLGEFGRTPTINGSGGRDHWPDCFSAMFAGGGAIGGAVHGSSDKLGAYPATDPTTPADLAATIYWRFGIDPAAEVHDQTGRPWPLSTGRPLERLFAG
jgi:hypothetical protein